MRIQKNGIWLLLLIAVSAPFNTNAAELTIAVASNFRHAAEVLSARFEADFGHRLKLSYGATGKHAAQILNGAPYDVFLAADSARPKLLERELGDLQRQTYALGKLALYSTNLKNLDTSSLSEAQFQHLAIANPKLAPYGKAAQEVLEALKLWQLVTDKLVRGENIAQTFQFVQSGNADLGLISYAQVLANPETGSHWLVPTNLHSPIEQQLVILRNSDAAEQFAKFLQSNTAREIIRKSGYELPHVK